VRRRIAAARDEQELPAWSAKVARSSRAAGSRRLTSSVEIVRVRGPDAANLAEVQLEAIKEVLTWALSLQHEQKHEEDRAA
jgi:hypothetical protein